MKKIYILHGWTYSFSKWQKFSDLFKKENIDLVFLKIPGLTAPTTEVWDIDKYTNWLKKELDMDKGKVILLGHSNGGRIAAYFAAKYSDKIEKLILIDAAGIHHKELYIQIKRFIFKTLTEIGKRFTSSETLKNFLYFLAGERDYQKASPNMKLSMVNLTRHDLTPFLRKIKTPTILIWGQNDKITPLSDGKLMNKLIANSKLIVINNARHAPFYTNPKEVFEIIKNAI